jgi:hypothetical protein
LRNYQDLKRQFWITWIITKNKETDLLAITTTPNPQPPQLVLIRIYSQNLHHQLNHIRRKKFWNGILSMIWLTIQINRKIPKFLI